MEPIRLWRVYCDGWNYTDDEEVSKIGEPIAALPRADFDALVKERDEAGRVFGELGLAAARHAGVSDNAPAMDHVAALCGVIAGLKAGLEATGRRTKDAETAAKKYREAASHATDAANAATARADKAEALLREARVGLDQCACCGWSELLARIDAQLAAKGQTGPTPADPTKPAPAAASAAGCTEQKEP